MGLAEIQSVLAQLYTDSALRERFLADPQKTGNELGLTTEEIEQISQLSARQVTFFAKSLHSKRFGEICKLLPLTYKVLDKKLLALFRQYAETYLPSGIKKHHDDAIHFACFIERICGYKAIEPAWLVALVRYEKALLLSSEATRRVTIYRSRYAIEKLIWSLERGEANPTPSKRPTLVLWLRITSRAQ